MNRILVLSLLCLALGAAFVAPASAQYRYDLDEPAAQENFRLGVQAYQRGRYAEALALFEKACRYRIYLVSQLPPDQVRQMGLIPVDDPAEALRQALGGLPEGWRGVVLPQASVTLCRVEPAA